MKYAVPIARQTRTVKTRSPVVRIALAMFVCPLAAAAASGERAAKEPVVVLDQARGSFRAFMRWRTPTLISPDGAPKPLLETKRPNQKEEDRRPVPVRAADGPGQGWTDPGFDGSWWPRAEPRMVITGAKSYELHDYLGYSAGNVGEWHTICLRGAFVVTDPEQVQDLRLSAGFHGGAVVYVNGREVCRAHLPAGPLTADTLAEPYPAEAYLRPDGKAFTATDERKAEFEDRRKARIRALPGAGGGADGVALPASLLRKGVNVVAVEARTAPIREVTPGQWEPSWPHVGVWEARLTAASTAGLVPCVGPGPGIAIANSSPVETIENWHYAQPCEHVFPVRLVGVRNGTFSGKVVLSSDTGFRLLKAAGGDLVQEGGAGRIAAAAGQVRWAEPPQPAVSYVSPESRRYDRLMADYPATISAVRAPREAKFAAAAVAPVWVTVRVPAEAPAGLYRGAFTVVAEGKSPVTFEVPLEVKVHAWTLPDPRDFTTEHNIYESPDSVAQYYRVPLWSDKHFELMGQSVEWLAAAGSRICTLNLVYNAPGFGNAEGMIRWVKKPDGTYDYGFSIVDRYLDLYAKHVGKPAIVLLNLWENPRTKNVWGYSPPDGDTPGVTALDSVTGKTERLPQPLVGTPENEAFWRPALGELRRRLEKRGWFDVTAVGSITIAHSPTPEMVEVYRNIWPDGKWLNCSHMRTETYAGAKEKPRVPVAYSEFCPIRGVYNPDGGPGRRFPRPNANPASGTVLFADLHTTQENYLAWGLSDPLVVSRGMSEATLHNSLVGIGRYGGDFWPLPIGPQGQYTALCRNYAAVNFVGQYDGRPALLSPGPDGPVSNEVFEQFREGVQVAEAIHYLLKAVDDKRVSDDPAAKVESLLNERSRYRLRTARTVARLRWLPFESSAWQERDDRLFALCAEAAAGAGGQGEPQRQGGGR